MTDKVFTLRLDEKIMEQVKTSAEKNKRSMAKEIEFILDFYYNERKDLKVPDEIAIKLIEFLKRSPDFNELLKKLD